MNKPVLAKSKAITIFLVFTLGYFISNLLRAITAMSLNFSEINSFKLAMLFVLITSFISYLFFLMKVK